jgi:flagellar biosynthesis protein FlhF
MQQFFTEKAPTYDEAEKKAREKYGERLTILTYETVKIPWGPFNLFSREGVQINGILRRYSQGTREAAGDIYPQTIRSMPKPQVYREPQYPVNPAAQMNTLDFAEKKEKMLALASSYKEQAKDNNVLDLKDFLAGEFRTIKEKLESSGLAGSREEHPSLNRLEDILILNDFPSSYRKMLLERVRKEFSLDGLNDFDAVQDKVLEWIGESIKIYRNDKFNVRPRIMILVGPTGVGKTTTVAKLAANFGIDSKKRTHKRNVVMITIDGYRIGAKEQVEKYSGLMQFPFFSTVEHDELKRIIAVNSEGTDLILVDTIGKNPRDMEELGKMKKLLDACGTLAEVYLVVAATTKSSDLLEILKQFEPFNYRAVIVTKMDETIRTGNIIGAVSEKAKPVSYITNGQKVPGDISGASVIQFLINLEGFKVNRIKLEEKFPDKGQEQMKQWR